MSSVHATAATRWLLQAWADPSAPLTNDQWSHVLGATRRSSTLGHLSLRFAQAGAAVPARVQEHFDSAAMLIRRRRQQLRHELLSLVRAVDPSLGPLILLKGAAYEVANLPLRHGRAPSDVDAMVARERLPAVEAALRFAGWESAELNAYDDRYYRDWSHEIPPMRHPDRDVELDLHHSITPGMRDDGVDASSLIAASVEVSWDGHRRFRVLQPVDQLIHCAVHTFKDSDLSMRLRESMDFDLLWRHHASQADAAFPGRLVERAVEFGQARSLWWSIHFARRWLGTPIPDEVLARLPGPDSARIALMQWLADRAMLPGPRQTLGGTRRLAAIALLARYQHRRLPLAKLVPHVIEKSRRRMTGSGH